MTTDYANYLIQDFLQRDNIEEITLTNPVTEVTLNPVRVVQRDLNYRETQLGGSLGLEPTDIVFDVGCIDLGGARINRGDTIMTADGTKYTVISASVKSVSGTNVYWSAICRIQL